MSSTTRLGTRGYRLAAEQAFLYERQFHDGATWPDLRHHTLTETRHAGPEALRQAAREGRLTTPAPSHMTAWCHGEGGIGLARLRALELLGDPTYAREAEAAVGTVLTSIETPGQSFSLCHGAAGHLDLLLEASHVLDRPDLQRTAVELATAAQATYESAGKPWPSGSAAFASDPSLMLGDAGVGLIYLRLHDPRVPSALLIRSPKPFRGQVSASARVSSVPAAHVRTYFTRSLGRISAYRQSQPSVPPPPAIDPIDTPVDYSRRLQAWLGTLGPIHRERLEDASRLDLTALRLQQNVDDFSLRFVEALLRRGRNEIAPETVFVRARYSELVHQRWGLGPGRPLA